MRRNLFNNTVRFFRNSFRGNRSFNTTTTTAANRFLIGGIGILFSSSVLLWSQNNSTKALENSSAKSGSINYQAVRKDIEGLLDRPNHDDGSMGPIFVRLAWHASGTYDKATGTGGSNGATMRFAPESEHGANAGLKIAVAALDPIKKKYPGLSYADLWTLASVVAIEEMGGPTIPWKPGRSDAADSKACPVDGRLPDANKKQDHIREIFYRMGFNDREIVALIGAHCLGRCHTDRSGFKGPWTRAPTTVSNMFYQELLNNKWRKKNWNGPVQYEDEKTGELMMLPADLAFIEDPQFRKYVEMYAKDSDLWFQDFAGAFSKLLDLGVKH